MNKKNIILVGGGGHARACIDVIEQVGIYNIVGLVGQRSEVGSTCAGYPILGEDSDLPEIRDLASYAIVAIGQIKNFAPRVEAYERLISLDFEMPTICSPRAYVSDTARLGKGTILLHDALVNAGANVGNNCIINTKALVEHDATVCDHCHIATGAIINGGAKILPRSFVGSNATIGNGVTLVDQPIVGAGKVVVK